MKAEGLQLKVGTHLYLQRSRRDGVTEVLSATLIDYIDGQELIIQPQDDDLFPSFKVGDTYTTRIVSDDKRYAYSAEVLFVIKQPQKRIHLTYPQELDGVYKRQAPRYQITKPIRLSLHTGDSIISIQVHDISRSGACLIAEISLAHGSDVLNIELRDPFDQSLITLHCLVRYVLVDMVEGNINYRHGVEFQFNNSEEQIPLDRFIEYLLHQRYAIPDSNQ